MAEHSTLVKETLYNRTIVLNLHTDELVGHVSGNLPVFNRKTGEIEIIENFGLDPKTVSFKALFKTEGAIYKQDRSKNKNQLLQATIRLTEEQYYKLSLITDEARRSPSAYNMFGIKNPNCVRWLDTVLKQAGIVDGMKNKWNYEDFKKLDFRLIKIPTKEFFDENDVEQYHIWSNAGMFPNLFDQSHKIKDIHAKRKEEITKQQREGDVADFMEHRKARMAKQAHEDNKKSFITWLKGKLTNESAKTDAPPQEPVAKPQPKEQNTAEFVIGDFFNKLKSTGCSQEEIDHAIETIAQDVKGCLDFLATIPKEEAEVILNCINGLVLEQQQDQKQTDKKIVETKQEGLQSSLYQSIKEYAPQLLEDIKELVQMGIAREEDKMRIQAQVNAYNRQIKEFQFNHDQILGMCQNLPKLEDFRNQLFQQATLSLERRRDFQEQLTRRLNAEIQSFDSHARNVNKLDQNYHGLVRSLNDISDKFKALGKSSFANTLFDITNMFTQKAAASSKHPMLLAIAGGMQVMQCFNHLQRQKYQNMLQDLNETVSSATHHTLSSLQQEIGAKNASLGNLLNLYLTAEQTKFMNKPGRMLVIAQNVIDALNTEEEKNDKLIKNSMIKIEQLKRDKKAKQDEANKAWLKGDKDKWDKCQKEAQCIGAEIDNEHIRQQNLEKNGQDLKENRANITREFIITQSLMPQTNVVYDFMTNLLPSEHRFEDQLYDTKTKQWTATKAQTMRPDSEALRNKTNDIFNQSCLDQQNQAQWKDNFIKQYIESMANIGITVTPEEAARVFDEKIQRSASDSLTGWINHAISIYEEQYHVQDQLIITALASANRFCLALANSRILQNKGFKDEAVYGLAQGFTFAKTAYQMHTLIRRIHQVGFNLLLGVHSKGSETGLDAIVYGVGTNIASLAINGLDIISMAFEMANLLNGYQQLSPDTKAIIREINTVAEQLSHGQQAIRESMERLGVKVDHIEYLSDKIATQTQFLMTLTQRQHEVLEFKSDMQLLQHPLTQTNASLKQIHAIYNELVKTHIKHRSVDGVDAMLVKLTTLAETISHGAHTAGNFPQQAISAINRPYVSSLRFDTIGHAQYHTQDTLEHEPANVRLLKAIAFVAIKCHKKCQHYAIAYDKQKLVALFNLLQDHSFNTLKYMNILANDMAQNERYNNVPRHLDQMQECWEENEQKVIHELHEAFTHSLAIYDYQPPKPNHVSFFSHQLSITLIQAYKDFKGQPQAVSIPLIENNRNILKIQNAISVEPISKQRGFFIPLMLPQILLSDLASDYPDLKRFLELEQEGTLRLKYEYEFQQTDEQAPFDFKLHIHYFTYSEKQGYQWHKYPHAINVFQTHSTFLTEHIPVPEIISRHAISNITNEKQHLFDKLLQLIYGYYGVYNLSDASGSFLTKNGTVTYQSVSERGWESLKELAVPLWGLQFVGQGIKSYYQSSLTNQTKYQAGLRCTREVTGIYGCLANRPNDLQPGRRLYVTAFQPDYRYDRNCKSYNATITEEHYDIALKPMQPQNLSTREIQEDINQRLKSLEELEKKCLNLEKTTRIKTAMSSDPRLITLINRYAEGYEPLIHVLRLLTSAQYRYVEYVEFLATELGYHHWQYVKQFVSSGKSLASLQEAFKNQFDLERLFVLIPQYFHISEEIALIYEINKSTSMAQGLLLNIPELEKEVKDNVCCAMTQNDLQRLEADYLGVIAEYKQRRRPIRTEQDRTIGRIINQWTDSTRHHNQSRPRLIAANSDSVSVSTINAFKRAVHHHDLKSALSIINNQHINIHQFITQERTQDKTSQTDELPLFIKEHSDVFLEIAVTCQNESLFNQLLSEGCQFDIPGKNQSLAIAVHHPDKTLFVQLLVYQIKYIHEKKETSLDEKNQLIQRMILQHSCKTSNLI